MGTRSIVAVPDGESWQGRYVHWDGYPTGVGEVLRLIVRRDGLDVAAHTLTVAHVSWSSIDGRGDGDPMGFERVPGYGIAHNDVEHVAWVRPQHISWEEWAYVLQTEGIDVYRVGLIAGSSPFTAWRGRVAYDDERGMALAQAGDLVPA